MGVSGAGIHVAWDESLVSYDFGAGHPLNPVRLALTMRLASDLGLLDRRGVQVVPPQPADDATLRTIHTDDYIAAVRAADGPGRFDLGHGLGNSDNPTFAGMHEASALVAGGTVAAALAVWEGRARRGVNISGGLHHAMADHASGFCVYNDVAIGIQALLDSGARRVAYVDVDVHHGDGVQAAFYDDPRVLTISLHESPQTLFPGTGEAGEIGVGEAAGTAVNVALPAATSDGGWLRAFHAVVPPVLATWRPEILVTQHGCDTHLDDPLAHMALTVDGQRASYLALRELAEELCDGRWVATGGGGYALVDVVPRAWSHLLALVTGDPLGGDQPVPERWRQYVMAQFGRASAPLRMGDGGDTSYRDWDDGYDPADWLDRSINATRKSVFPLHGLHVT
jgi:acetoin utilization protein AcuC